MKYNNIEGDYMDDKYIDLLLNRCLNFDKAKSLFISYDVINSDLGYEMIVVAFDKWENHNDMDLYYSKSSDGITWDKATVILKPTRGTGFWDNRGIYRSSFVKINGTYIVYYGGTNESLHHGMGLVYGKDIHNLKSTNVNFSNKEESNKFAKKLESELK